MTTPTPPKTTATAKLQTITPKLAEEWLTHNTHNRPLRDSQVAALQGVIERGEWVVNGDTIRFGAGGKLLDGQHRLYAIALSGIPVDTFVVKGLVDRVQSTVDVGAKRSLADALRLEGITNAVLLAAALSYYWRILNGHVRLSSVRPTITQGLALFDSSPGFRDAMTVSARVRSRFRISGGMLTAVYYQFSQIDVDAADMFIDKLIDGVGLTEHDPIYVLRQRLIRNGAGSMPSTLMTHALIVKAWNAWRNGEEVVNLTWRPSGVTAEAFPEPQR